MFFYLKLIIHICKDKKSIMGNGVKFMLRNTVMSIIVLFANMYKNMIIISFFYNYIFLIIKIELKIAFIFSRFYLRIQK